MGKLRHGVFAAAALAGAALSPQPAQATGEAASRLVATGLTYPMAVTGPPGDLRLFVVERGGRIRIVKGGSVLATPFLDLTGQVRTTGEEGLLDVAFPPDYAASGLFYVHHTDLAGDTRIVRYRVSGNPDLADPSSAQLILLIDQPPNRGGHKAGSIHFGPDGFLWFPTGDGGGANDPDELAQNPLSLLGKVLRIDVGPTFAPGSLPVSGALYRIPADNPFAGSSSVRNEIWALGMRNPYRSSFDRRLGDLWLTDVGQDAREEINFVPGASAGGLNFGWDVMEGTVCNPNDPAPSPPCNSLAFTGPLLEYDQSTGNCAIIGGYVYRTAIDPLDGHYFFGDYCSGRVYSFNMTTFSILDRTVQLGAGGGVPFTLVGFGEDGRGQLYVVHASSGSIWRIVAADPACADGVDNDGDALVDFPADPGCRSALGTTELLLASCGIGPELCVLLPALLALRRWRSAGARA